MEVYKKLGIVSLLLMLFLTSCGSEDDQGKFRIQIDRQGKKAAISLCECMMEHGYNPYISQEEGGRELLNDLEDAIMHCFVDFMMEFGTSFMQMKKKEKKIFIKGFLHALIETECFKNSVDNFPDFIFDDLDDLSH